MKPISIIIGFLLFSFFLNAQNNTYLRTGGIFGYTEMMDKGNGESHWLIEERFGFDSTHIHFMSADASMQLEHHLSYRTSSPLSYIRAADPVDNGIIIGGAALGFNTTAYVLRAQEDGNLPWSVYFSNLTGGNDQIHDVFTNGDRLDLVTWADNTDSHFYLIQGFTDGTFPTALQINAPEETEIRIDCSQPMENPGEYMLICQADTVSSFSKFLYIMHIDSTGIISSRMHDHDQSMTFETETGLGLIPTQDGNWVYTAVYNDAGNGLENRLVKMETDGEVLWSKEYYLNGEQLFVSLTHETTDGGLLFTAFNFMDSFIIRTDEQGNVLWSKRYEQDEGQVFPLGAFYKNDQDQLYGFNEFAVVEIDESVNICDLVPFSGIVAEEVSINTAVVNTTVSTINPEVLPYPIQIRNGDVEHSLDCQSVSLAEEFGSAISIGPNPVADILAIQGIPEDMSVSYTIIDIQGNQVSMGRTNGSSHVQIDTSSLSSSMYLLRINYRDMEVHKRFIKR